MGKLDMLRDSPLLAGLDKTELKTLEMALAEKSIPEGKTVFVENMVGESLYLIEQGAVTISKMLAEGDERILVVLGAEEFFGEMAIIDELPRFVTARVAENARLLRLKRKDFETLCLTHPHLGFKLMRNIARSLARQIHDNSEHYREMLIWSLSE